MFENILGNENVLTILRNMLKDGRLPHAIILEGEEGLGKHSVAREFAKAVLCEETQEYCGTCRNCALFSASTHPDFFVISPSGSGTNTLKKEDIDYLRKNVYIKPDRAKKKVFIIENAEKMSDLFQNALLKILEEPPEYILYILLTDSSKKLLDTTLSRCTVLRLNAPPIERSVEYLKKEISLDEKYIFDVLETVDGNIGKAKMMLSGDGKGGAVANDVENLIVSISSHRSYEILKILSKYQHDTKNFLFLLDLLENRTSASLRKLSIGEKAPLSLSKQGLLSLLDELREVKKLMYNKTADLLILTYFSAKLSNL